jgi:hypothetical protein
VRLLVSALAFALTSSAHANGTEDWSISPRELRRQVKSICVWPLEADFAVVDQEARRGFAERLLAHALDRTGYRVVPATETAAAHAAARSAAGGSYDPLDGARDHALERAALEATLARPELNCDADLRGRFVRLRADFRDDARWDGAREWVWPGNFGGSLYGYVPAISLELELRSRAGRPLYRGAGGIHLTVRFDREARPVPVPPALWLADRSLNARGAALALGGLIDSIPTGDVLDCMKGAYRKAMFAKGLRKTPTQQVVQRWTLLEDDGRRAHAECLVATLPPEAATP